MKKDSGRTRYPKTNKELDEGHDTLNSQRYQSTY
jgi:hypothetical protein